MGNHDVPIPREPDESPNIESDQKAKERFTQRYGNKVFADGTNRFQAFDADAATSLRLALKPSFNVVVPVMTNGSVSHELVLLDAMDLVAMQRDHYKNDGERVSPPINAEAEALMRTRFPDTYDFVTSLANGNSTRSVPRVIISHVPHWRKLPSQADNKDMCSIASRSARHGVWREHSGAGLRQDFDRMDTYQNLLGPAISDWVKQKVAWTGGAIFSGDDHDHCEYAHEVRPPFDHALVQDFGRYDLPELTVKSMSITMSVRKPGFARITLFPARGDEDVAMAYTPCLLPDRIGLSMKAYTFLTLFGVGVLAFIHNTGLRAALQGRFAGTRARTADYEPVEAGRRAPRRGSRPTGFAQAIKDLVLLLVVFALVFYAAVAIL